MIVFTFLLLLIMRVTLSPLLGLLYGWKVTAGNGFMPGILIHKSQPFLRTYLTTKICINKMFCSQALEKRERKGKRSFKQKGVAKN